MKRLISDKHTRWSAQWNVTKQFFDQPHLFQLATVITMTLKLLVDFPDKIDSRDDEDEEGREGHIWKIGASIV
jgi:hypothetical protein